MKRLASAALAFCLVVLLFAPPVSAAAATAAGWPAYSRADLLKLPSAPVSGNDLQDGFLPAGNGWRTLAAGVPATRLDASVELADGVIEVGKPVTDSLADLGQALSGSTIQKQKPNRIIEQGGYVPRSVLDAAASQNGKAVKNGSVVVDRDSGTAFKVVSPTIYTGIFDSDPELRELVRPLEATYAVTKPELHDVVKKFDLPGQTVALTKGNITGFAPNVELSALPKGSFGRLAVDGADKRFKTLTGDNLIELLFENTPLQGKVGSSTISLTLAGGVAIGGIDLTGRYSANGGYEVSLSLQQECYLVAQLDAEIKEDIRVPLLAIDVPFGVGSVYGGIFALIGMDGTIRLDIEARETSACRMGIRGGTFLYVPTSFYPVFEPTPPKITGDCSMLGKINGSIRFGPLLGIELFGFDLVGAGAMLGAGVIVDSDGSMLDIELYASIDVYVVLLDEAFTLARARPTIYRKQQPDMHGYKVSFLETYVNPGRVGGLIEEEPTTAGAAYVPAVGLEYRVWIVPKAVATSFPVADREARLQADRENSQKQLRDKVRTYPAAGVAHTNAEGEFIEKDSQICFAGDHVYLEFKGDGHTFFVGPATPVLPFTDITITGADLFNDYITGKVEPKRLIRWESDRTNPNETQQELAYYSGPIDISPFNDYGFMRQDQSTYTAHRPYVIEGTAHTGTNAQGEFDTRAADPASGVAQATGSIDVLSEDTPPPVGAPGPHLPGTVGVVASLKINDAVNNVTVYGIVPTAPEFQFTRTRTAVADSWQRLTEGDRIIDRMAYDELIWIANPNGTRTITADMLEITAAGFSTQDYKGYYENPVKATRDGPVSLTPVLDDQGNPTGSALFAQRVTVEWVWQAHPNPIRITSVNQATVTAGQPASFTITASGWFPRFSLNNQPAGVAVDEKTGVMTLPPTLPPGTYPLTVHAEESLVLVPFNMPDPTLGNAASPPDEQAFTLTVSTEPVAVASPTPTIGPSVTPVPSVTARPSPTRGPLQPTQVVNPTPPIFEKRRDDYQFSMGRGASFTVQLTATGTAPIAYSIEPMNERLPVPSQITIDAATGLLTVVGNLITGIAAGTYDFNVRAVNPAGSAVQTCRLQVTPGIVLPTIRPTLRGPAAGQPSSDGLLQGPVSGLAARRTLSGLAARKPATGLAVRQPAVWLTTAMLAVTKKAGMSPGVNLPPASLKPDLFKTQPPPNRLTLRCDDPRDVYTRDRDTLNGAAFIAWDTSVKLALVDVMVDTSKAGVFSDYTYYEVATLGDTYEAPDPAPVCENYHYYHPEAVKPTIPLTKEQLEAVKTTVAKALGAEMAQYRNGYKSSRDNSAGGLRDRYLDFRVNPVRAALSSLEYGALVKEIGSGKAGRFTVDLNAETGTVVAGEYFTGLQGNRQAEITFRQAGADITFAGQDIQSTAGAANGAGGPAGAGLTNIGLTAAPHAQAMLAAIGSDAQSFTFGFQHHGDLPGMATFAITTGLAAGSTVNVYRFDAATSQFALIAGNRETGAGGLVTYKNNSMSEYVITTKAIAGAAVSAVAGLQGDSAAVQSGSPHAAGAGLIVGGAALATFLLAAAAGLLLRRRRQARKSAEPQPQ